MTLSVAYRNMRAGKGRMLFAVSGVAVATLLLAFMLGLYRGWTENVVAYVRDVHADVWVAQRGGDNFFTPSFVANTYLVPVQQTKYVEQMNTLVGRALKLKKGDGEWDALVMGFDAGGLGRPIHIKEGAGNPATGEIVLDDVLARTAGIHLGDEVQAGLERLKVVGIMTGGNLVFAQLAFVSKEEGRILVGIQGYANFALLKVTPGHVDDVVNDINTHVPGLTAFKGATFTANSQRVVKRSIVPVLTVILALAFVVGVIVVALTIYTSTIEKEREFGVMKALGTPALGLFRVVLEQSVVCGIFGFAAGILATMAVSSVAGDAVPQLATNLEGQDVLIAFGAAMGMSVLAALVPAGRIIRVDPLTVFKA